MSELAKALVAFQKNAPKIERGKTVNVKTEKGSYTFKYATFDAITDTIREALAENDLAHSALLSTTEAGHPSLRIILMHAGGERLESEFPLPLRGGENAQQIGSVITYMRRYGLISILGLATEEDDDGNAASGNVVKPKADPVPKPDPDSQFKPPQQDRAKLPATEEQRKFMVGLATNLHDHGLFDETQETSVKAAAANPKTSRKAASDAIERMQELAKDIPVPFG